MDSSDHAIRASSFGAAAAAYQRGRPPYPSRAIDWLVPATTRRILELGAGTGKLTRQLHERGLDVIAAEPDEQMRAELVRQLPDVAVLPDSAEALSLRDHSVDTIIAAQAWHWVDVDRALPETVRTLTPGGTLSLVWNTRDEREDWVAQLGRIMHPQGALPTHGIGVDAIQAPFAPVEHRTFEWRHPLTRAALLDLVASRSYTITRPPEDRAALLAEVRTLCDTHPALAGTDEITMPYITHCYRTRLL